MSNSFWNPKVAAKLGGIFSDLGTFNMNDIYHIIFNLLDEISTEIDLHYEDEQAAGLMHTFTRIKPAADWLTANGHDLPDPYRHILQRFEPALTDNLH